MLRERCMVGRDASAGFCFMTYPVIRQCGVHRRNDRNAITVPRLRPAYNHLLVRFVPEQESVEYRYLRLPLSEKTSLKGIEVTAGRQCNVEEWSAVLDDRLHVSKYREKYVEACNKPRRS